jgi:hypothetical protein
VAQKLGVLFNNHTDGTVSRIENPLCRPIHQLQAGRQEVSGGTKIRGTMTRDATGCRPATASLTTHSSRTEEEHKLETIGTWWR